MASAVAHLRFRLNKAAQFKELAKDGHTIKTEHFLARVLPKKSGNLGFAVKATKKNFKKACDRNYAKRRLRHLIYVTKPSWQGHIVLVAHKSIITCNYAAVLTDFERMIAKQKPNPIDATDAVVYP